MKNSADPLKCNVRYVNYQWHVKIIILTKILAVKVKCWGVPDVQMK